VCVCVCVCVCVLLQRFEINHNELECDFVSVRIVELLNEDNFELSVDYLKYVHKFLFQDVYEFAGKFRKIDFSKHENILNVIYL